MRDTEVKQGIASRRSCLRLFVAEVGPTSASHGPTSRTRRCPEGEVRVRGRLPRRTSGVPRRSFASAGRSRALSAVAAHAGDMRHMSTRLGDPAPLSITARSSMQIPTHKPASAFRSWLASISAPPSSRGIRWYRSPSAGHRVGRPSANRRMARCTDRPGSKSVRFSQRHGAC